MTDLPLDEEGLKLRRVQAVQERKDAKAKGNDAAVAAATQIIEEIDDALDDLAIVQLQELATRLKELQAKLDEAKKKATLLGGIQDLAKKPGKPRG
jgi:N-acetylglucosamine kinase-like BadF-type ATPase